MDPDLSALLEAMAQRIDELEAQLTERDAQIRAVLSQQDTTIGNITDHVAGLYERLSYLNAGPARTVTAKELSHFVDRSERQTALNCGERRAEAEPTAASAAPKPTATSFADLLARKREQ